MSDGTKIEWTDATWNVVNGCTVHSPGCANCYAMRLAATRMRYHASRAGLARWHNGHAQWTGEVRFDEKVLTQPLRWRRQRRIFVCAHGDLFHEKVPDEWIDRVFAVMALASHHQFQVLTKRPDRMRAYMAARLDPGVREETITSRTFELSDSPDLCTQWPLSNVWLGVSVEDQQRADERIPQLLATPAAVRWLSCEPLLGPVKLPGVDFHCDLCGGTGTLARWPKGRCQHCNGRGSIPAISTDPKFGTPSTPMRTIDWVVAGFESGPGARRVDDALAIARSLRDQCAAAAVPFLFKQWGAWLPAGQVAATTSLWKPSCGSALLTTKANAGRLLDGRLHDGFPA